MALSAAALWPREPLPVVQAVAATTPHAEPAPAPLPAAAPPRAAPGDAMQLAAAAGDPFFLPAPPAPPPPPAQAPTLAAPPPPPPPPELTHRFFGRLTTPSGEEVMLLARGNVPVPVTQGMTLADGYVVQAILPEAVRVTFPPLGTVIDIPVPPPPSQPR